MIGVATRVSDDMFHKTDSTVYRRIVGAAEAAEILAVAQNIYLYRDDLHDQFVVDFLRYQLGVSIDVPREPCAAQMSGDDILLMITVFGTEESLRHPEQLTLDNVRFTVYSFNRAFAVKPRDGRKSRTNLTYEEIDRIISRHHEGAKVGALAEVFNTTPATIRNVIRGRTQKSRTRLSRARWYEK